MLVIGIDGLEWNVVLDLLREDELPNLARHLANGTFGELETMHPSLSPTVWASIATGMRPADHGIRGFVKAKGGGQELFTNRDRRVKALWNIATDYDLTSAVIGWWSTFPVEPLKGVMVAQVNTSLDGREETGSVLKGGVMPTLRHQVQPEELSSRMLGIAGEVDGELEDLLPRIFGRPEPAGEDAASRMWKESRWSLRADLAYERIALSALRDPGGFDLCLVYFGGTDVLAHRFWRWAYPAGYRFPPDESSIESYGSIVFDYYRYMDEAIGRLVAAAPPDTVVVILSDHGMDAANRKAPFDTEVRVRPLRSGAHGRTDAFFVASGPGIRSSTPGADPSRMRREDVPRLGTIFDVTPTLLALLGIPVGADMPGEVLFDVIEPSFLTANPVHEVSTHTPRGWFEKRVLPEVETPRSDERLQQLRSLGYIQ